jgi:hypothetical protein
MPKSQTSRYQHSSAIKNLFVGAVLGGQTITQAARGNEFEKILRAGVGGGSEGFPCRDETGAWSDNASCQTSKQTNKWFGDHDISCFDHA